MLHQRPVAAYPFTQAALWQRCLDLFPSLDRDIDRLARFGVTPARVAKFKADTAAFGLLEPDAVLVQEGAIETEEKNAEREALVTSIQQVMACIELKDDPRTAAYKRFGVVNVANATEAALHLAGAVVVKQGRKYLASYAGVGLTAEMLDAVETNNAKFVEELATGKEAENDRQDATDTRIEAANALYEELTKLCGAGNVLWRFEDETKADEYVVERATSTTEINPTGPTA
ncbi:hypothetical protein [Hymenobacter terrenus]|uniref:hypothetical protein n=1 Tax=Hymenobacter terrenus TaxID=1629124 RepID=UPI0006198C83|nr:hypothetical protein [Hymenobacter terrenus]